MSGGVFGLVTARGGSKGLSRKNIRMIAGKPLIAWTIRAALGSKYLDQVIVSTEDEEIANVSREWGAKVPFVRPVELAGDESSHLAVVEHAIRWLAEHENSAADYVMLLQPTSPLRTAKDIDAAIELAEERNAIAVVSVSDATHHPYLCQRVLPDGALADFIPHDRAYARRQDLPRAYAFNGAIYLNRCESILRDRTFTPTGTHAYIMPPERSIDVDTPWDFRLAELVLMDSRQTV